MQENFNVIDWELSEDDYTTLCKLEPQHRQFPMEEDDEFDGYFHPEGPYRHEADLWDNE